MAGDHGVRGAAVTRHDDLQALRGAAGQQLGDTGVQRLPHAFLGEVVPSLDGQQEPRQRGVGLGPLCRQVGPAVFGEQVAASSQLAFEGRHDSLGLDQVLHRQSGAVGQLLHREQGTAAEVQGRDAQVVGPEPLDDTGEEGPQGGAPAGTGAAGDDDVPATEPDVLHLLALGRRDVDEADRDGVGQGGRVPGQRRHGQLVRQLRGPRDGAVGPALVGCGLAECLDDVVQVGVGVGHLPGFGALGEGPAEAFPVQLDRAYWGGRHRPGPGPGDPGGLHLGEGSRRGTEDRASAVPFGDPASERRTDDLLALLLVGDAEAHAQAHVGIDLAGDDAAGPLRRQEQMHTDRPTGPGDGDQPVQLLGGLVLQLGELVGDHDEAWHRGRRPAGDGHVALDGSGPGRLQEPDAAAHLGLQQRQGPVEGSGVVEVGGERHRMRQPDEGPVVPTSLEVDEEEGEVVGVVLQRQRRDERLDELALARTGRARHQRMGAVTRQVEGDGAFGADPDRGTAARRHGPPAGADVGRGGLQPEGAQQPARRGQPVVVLLADDPDGGERTADLLAAVGVEGVGDDPAHRRLAPAFHPCTVDPFAEDHGGVAPLRYLQGVQAEGVDAQRPAVADQLGHPLPKPCGRVVTDQQDAWREHAAPVLGGLSPFGQDPTELLHPGGTGAGVGAEQEGRFERSPANVGQPTQPAPVPGCVVAAEEHDPQLRRRMEDRGLQDQRAGQRPDTREVADQREPAELHEGHPDGQPRLWVVGIPFRGALDFDVGGREGGADADGEGVGVGATTVPQLGGGACGCLHDAGGVGHGMSTMPSFGCTHDPELGGEARDRLAMVDLRLQHLVAMVPLGGDVATDGEHRGHRREDQHLGSAEEERHDRDATGRQDRHQQVERLWLAGVALLRIPDPVGRVVDAGPEAPVDAERVVPLLQHDRLDVIGVAELEQAVAEPQQVTGLQPCLRLRHPLDPCAVGAAHVDDHDAVGVAVDDAVAAGGVGVGQDDAVAGRPPDGHLSHPDGDGATGIGAADDPQDRPSGGASRLRVVGLDGHHLPVAQAERLDHGPPGQRRPVDQRCARHDALEFLEELIGRLAGVAEHHDVAVGAAGPHQQATNHGPGVERTGVGRAGAGRAGVGRAGVERAVRRAPGGGLRAVRRDPLDVLGAGDGGIRHRPAAVAAADELADDLVVVGAHGDITASTRPSAKASRSRAIPRRRALSTALGSRSSRSAISV